ncbi:hypothetical protein XU18_1739 [Perkinsela sp. CCAP 1560/4]|nr:hypothetical protein XU18_1739 [Perkinsela sp. CCAP 1560/4]|eukprot:KNH07645.1 hypothetical protein XU18_1739 [Perkinsela sp. CCAP 1560/4]
MRRVSQFSLGFNCIFYKRAYSTETKSNLSTEHESGLKNLSHSLGNVSTETAIPQALSVEDSMEAQLQKLHDLSCSLCEIVKKKPYHLGNGALVPSGIFGQYEYLNESETECRSLAKTNEKVKSNTDSVYLREMHALQELYQAQYTEISSLLSDRKLILALMSSAKWHKGKVKINGLPMHRIRHHMHICFMHQHKPSQLGIIGSNRNRRAVGNETDTSRSSGDVGNFPQSFSRSLRDRDTVKKILRLIETEWPKDEKADVIPLYKRLLVIEPGRQSA